MTATTTGRRRSVLWSVATIAAAALMSSCASGTGGEATAQTDATRDEATTTAETARPGPATSPSESITSSPADVGTPSSAPASTVATDGPTSSDAGGVPSTLLSAPFSGYADVREEVVAWSLECPPDFEGVVPQRATAMGTAREDLDAESFTLRQVAVFDSAEDAVQAAGELGRYAQEQCAGQYEPQPGFITSRSTVEPLDTGAQGLLVDTAAEDYVAATAVLRRGTAVALVTVSALPPYPGGRSAAEDVRAAAPALYEQLCRYERNAC